MTTTTGPATTAAATSDIDLFADEVLLDPYPAFSELREKAAVVYLPANGAWALTRYDAIRDALGNPAVFSSNKVAFNDDMNHALEGTSLATDPPDHTRLRAALTENLSPRALRSLKSDIDAKADAMVAELVERGSFDAIDDLARAFPLNVVADLVGVEGEIKAKMLRWAEAAFNVLGPMNQRTIDNFPVAGELFGWAVNVQASDLTEGSMGRAIFAAAERGEIPMESCGHIIHQYVAAGVDSTIATLGNAVAHLGANPDQYDLLREDPSLIPATLNEVLRYEAPVHAFGRLVKEDIDVDGTVIPAGAQAAILFGSGNRDDRHYDDPDRFLVKRNPLDHLSFGYGVHGCAGQGLARLEIHAVLNSLVTRVKRYEVGSSTRNLSNMMRSLNSLAVTRVEPA